jgi:hypothetical protein
MNVMMIHEFPLENRIVRWQVEKSSYVVLGNEWQEDIHIVFSRDAYIGVFRWDWRRKYNEGYMNESSTFETTTQVRSDVDKSNI